MIFSQKSCFEHHKDKGRHLGLEEIGQAHPPSTSTELCGEGTQHQVPGNRSLLDRQNNDWLEEGSTAYSLPDGAQKTMREKSSWSTSTVLLLLLPFSEVSSLH